MFDPNKPYTNRAGDEVKIIYTMKDGRYLVVEIENESYCYVNKDGRLFTSTESPNDLINVPEKVELWINVHKYTSDLVVECFKTREEADKCSFKERIACIPITFYEGEGL